MYKEGIHFMDYRTILQEENDAVRERWTFPWRRAVAAMEKMISGSLTAIILDAFPALY